MQEVIRAARLCPHAASAMSCLFDYQRKCKFYFFFLGQELMHHNKMDSSYSEHSFDGYTPEVILESEEIK